MAMQTIEFIDLIKYIILMELLKDNGLKVNSTNNESVHL